MARVKAPYHVPFCTVFLVMSLVLTVCYLLSFVEQRNPDEFQPSVTGTEQIQDVMCFDEKYVSQFTFQPDELISNSFDIFIKTEAYNQTEREIDSMVMAIRQEFSVMMSLSYLYTSSGA